MERTIAPVNVSPLIKSPCNFIPSISNPDTNSPATRWGLLIAGVLYGSARYSRLYKKEGIRLAELERTREEREAREKAERDLKTQREIDELVSQLGVKI